MMRNSTYEKSIYQKIALDIANKIVRGEFKSEEKISGRSTLASMYNVSPETVRRALALLKEQGVVSINKGSGIEILSISAAEKYIEKNKSTEYISTVKDEIIALMDEKKEIDDKIEDKFNQVMDMVDRFKNISPFTLIEIEIKENCKSLGKKVKDIMFWQNTGATMLAYRRGSQIFISPGPEYVFTSGDVIVVIGNNDVYERTSRFLYSV